LDITAPYAETIYKQFRTEVCAECWKYDGGRRTFLTQRDLGSAGLFFCDDRCKEQWLEHEGEEVVKLLAELEGARRRKEKGKEKEEHALYGDGATNSHEDMEQCIAQAWEVIRHESTRPKTLRQWKSFQLDEFETDIARYVVIALYHYARELHSLDRSSSWSGQLRGSASSALNESFHFGHTSWTDFSSLQSGELQQVTRYPELLTNHIRIYQVLRSRFGFPVQAPANSAPIPPLPSQERERFASTLTVENVRTTLSVDPGNSFGIWEAPVTEESEGLGFGVYPIPSFFNHSCFPNVRKDRSGRRLRFITTQDVDADEELCISYGHVEGMDLKQRRNELWEGWFFLCRCNRCLEEEAVIQA